MTSAAANLGKASPQASQLFDHQIYWSMAAADSGRAAGKAARAVETEVRRDATTAEGQLRSQDGATTAALAGCVRRVPALND